MTTFEAVQTLSARAGRAARLAWLVGAALIVLTFVGVLGVQLLIVGRPSKAMGFTTTWITIVAAAVILPSVRFAVKQVLRMRRLAWVEELARKEGLDSQKIADSFTLDSW